MSDLESYRISAKQLEERTVSRDIIPCTLSLDIGLGGGIPFGCTVLIGGKSKSGKTTISLTYGSNAQNLFNSKIIYFNIEGRLTSLVMSQIPNLKKDIDHFEIIMPPPKLDKKGDIVGQEKWPAEKWWDLIGQAILNNPKAIIIIDSIASLSSEKEQSEEIGYQDRGGKNKLESQFCRKYGGAIVANQVVVFILTHVQANTSGYGPAIQAKVGNSIKHQADVIMFCKKVEKWPEQSGKILGHDIHWEIECSALGPPWIDVTVPLRYGYGVDTLMDIVTNAITWGFIEKSGSWYTMPFKEIDGKLEYQCPVTDDCIKVQGEHGARNWLLIRPEQAKLLTKAVREKIFVDIK